MNFKLEALPKIIQFEVFSYVEAERLLDLRFLNKSIFELIKGIIYNHLCYSIYHNSDSFKAIQNDFTNKYSSHVKHLIIPQGMVLDFLKRYNTIEQMIDGEYCLPLTFENPFTRLISLSITIHRDTSSFNYIDILNYFKQLLLQVDKLTLYANYNIDLSYILPLLNPNKLRCLKIKLSSGSALIMNGIMQFQLFKILESLELDVRSIEIESAYLPNSEDVIFSSLRNLKIYGLSNTNDLQLAMFGKIINLDSICLDLPEYTLKTIQFIQNTKIHKTYLTYTYYYLSNINFVFILDTLKPIINIQSKISVLINSMVSEINEEESQNLNSFLYIHEITFFNCYVSIQYVFELLKWLPNIKKVAIKHSILLNRDNSPLVLPTNLDNFLLCVDTYSLRNNKMNILRLLNGLNVLFIK